MRQEKSDVVLAWMVAWLVVYSLNVGFSLLLLRAELRCIHYSSNFR